MGTTMIRRISGPFQAISILKLVAVLGVAFSVSACDFYEDKISDDWSLCAVDNPDDMRLCRNLGENQWRYVMDPVMVAWGYSGRYISLRRCFEGEEEFYSVDSTHTGIYAEPNYIGPFTRAEWQQAALDEPELWPEIDETWRGLEKRHCPKVN